MELRAAFWSRSASVRRSSWYARRAVSSSGSSPRMRARAMASSSASLVPEPMEKCAVWAASPISTAGATSASGWYHCSQETRTKLSQGERRWGELLRSGCPSSQGANIASQRATVSSISMASKPAPRHDASSHSTMKAECPSS